MITVNSQVTRCDISESSIMIGPVVGLTRLGQIIDGISPSALSASCSKSKGQGRETKHMGDKGVMETHLPDDHVPRNSKTVSKVDSEIEMVILDSGGPGRWPRVC